MVHPRGVHLRESTGMVRQQPADSERFNEQLLSQ